MRLDLGGLNNPQREAVLHDDGPLLVLAGAGSGKTRVIIFRIARLLQEGVPSDSILGVTFTNKAAREMRERLAVAAGEPGRQVQLLTFHALGLRILQKEHDAANLAETFSIYDTSDQLGLVRELMRRVQVADRRLDAPRVLEIILRTKRERRQNVALDWGDDYELAAYELYPRYVAELQAQNAVDFDDLLLRTQDVLNVPEVRARWQKQFTYLLVDEYQDTSPDQVGLLKILAAEHHNVMVVGDDDQSIYAWRGAQSGNILHFAQQFPGAKEVILDQNYRSTNSILAAANAVIKNNVSRKAKALWSAAGDGAPVEVVTCKSGDDEATFVADTIGALLHQRVKADEIAVLYRSNAQSRVFEETLRLAHIPYRLVGGQSFFDRKEVRDVLAYLAAAFNPRDEMALRRIINVPARGLGPTSVQRLAEHGNSSGRRLWGALNEASQIPDLPKAAIMGAKDLVALLRRYGDQLRQAAPGQVASLAREFLEATGLRQTILDDDDAPSIRAHRLDNLEEVVSALARFENQGGVAGTVLRDFLRSSVLDRAPEEDPKVTGGQVTVMTIHSAKGLEFENVFLVGLEDELMPHRKTMEMGGDLGEERRLCYVGITRAKCRLWLTLAAARQKYGRPEPRTPSRFLAELPDSPAILRRRADEIGDGEQNDAAADEFFKKMRVQLGM